MTYEEARLAGKSFGSTKSGIAPFYSDKYAKIGFQVQRAVPGRSRNSEDKGGEVSARRKTSCSKHLVSTRPELDPGRVSEIRCMEYKEMVAPYVCDVSEFLHEAV